jgi:hypothetical protein
VGAESEKLGHLGPFGACRNRPDFFGGQLAACKLLKTMKSQVGGRLKSANPGPANAQEATYLDVFDRSHEMTFCAYLDKSLSTFNNMCNTYNNAN